MGVSRIHGDTAVGRQPFGIGKRDARYACTVPTGIDANEEFPLPTVGIKFLIELLHDLHGFRTIEIGIHHLITRGKVPVKIQ